VIRIILFLVLIGVVGCSAAPKQEPATVGAAQPQDDPTWEKPQWVCYDWWQEYPFLGTAAVVLRLTGLAILMGLASLH
jgi:hypothetical protein